MKNKIFNQNGITLIALIITIIVMLILVGVTISVALNGGLFETATKAATETKKETERERLTEVALASYNVAESKISDVDSLVGKLSGMGFSKDESKSSVSNAKLVVQGSTTLWQIDLISATVEPYVAGETYTFTIGELGKKELLPTDASGMMTIPASSFWREDASEQLKNSATQKNEFCQLFNAKTYDITCSDSSYTNLVDIQSGSAQGNSYAFLISNDDTEIYFTVFVQDANDEIDANNYASYADLAFTISMPE